MRCANDDFIIDHDIPKRLGPNYISTHSYTPETTYTKIIIPDKKRLIFLSIEIAGNVAADILSDSNILCDLAQFTKIKLRTTAFPLGDIGGTLRETAALLLGTCQASVRVISKNIDKILLAPSIRLRSGDFNLHPLFHGSHTS
jgi:hypothetical protein